MDTERSNISSQADGYNSADNPSESLVKFREASVVYKYVYPLYEWRGNTVDQQSWEAKQSPPKGMHGYATEQHPWPLPLDNEEEFISWLSENTTGGNASTYAWHVFHAPRFSFAAYPPVGYAALDIDKPEVVHKVCGKLGIDTDRFIDLIENSPAIINTKERGHCGHVYIKLSENSGEQIDQLQLLNDFMDVVVDVGGKDVNLGDLIAAPYTTQRGRVCGNYQKIHGGYPVGEAGIERSTYRMVDSYNVEQPYRYLYEALHPDWLFEQLQKTVGRPQPMDFTRKPVTAVKDSASGSLWQPAAIAKLADKHLTVEYLMKELDKNKPEGCNIVGVKSGKPRVHHVDQKNEPGGQINLSTPGASTIKFHSETVKKAFVGSACKQSTIKLTTIALLPQALWPHSGSLDCLNIILQQLEAMETVDITPYNVSVIEDKLLKEIPQPENSLPHDKIRYILDSSLVQRLIQQYKLPTNMDTENNKQAALRYNCCSAIKALQVYMSSKDTYVTGNTLRCKGELFEGKSDVVEQLGYIVDDHIVAELIYKYPSHFYTPGWVKFRKSVKDDAEAKSYGWFDVITGDGHTTLAAEDDNGDVYTPDVEDGHMKLISEFTPTRVMSFMKTNHLRFTKLTVGDAKKAREVLHLAAKPIGLFTRMLEGWTTRPYNKKTKTYENFIAHSEEHGTGVLPHPDSETAIVLARIQAGLNNRSQALLHFYGRSKSSEGKTEALELIEHIMPGHIRTSVNAAFSKSKPQDNTMFIGKNVYTIDDADEICKGMEAGFKTITTSGKTARRLYGNTFFKTKKMSGYSNGNSPLMFAHADGQYTALTRRLLNVATFDGKKAGDNHKQFLSNLIASKVELQAFVSVILQLDLYGLGAACDACLDASIENKVVHPGMLSLHKKQRDAGIIATPIADWLRDNVVYTVGAEVDRMSIFKAAQLDPYGPLSSKDETHFGRGQAFLSQLTDHIAAIGGGASKRLKRNKVFVQIHKEVACPAIDRIGEWKMA